MSRPPPPPVLLTVFLFPERETDSPRFFHRATGVNYRKSIYPDAAFPGNLLDALSGYLYLVNELGFEPQNVIAMGDSAGGNTALGLARYLGELDREKRGVGQVGGLVLFSVSLESGTGWILVRERLIWGGGGDSLGVI